MVLQGMSITFLACLCHARSMKNRYPGACTKCEAQVLPGQGTIHRVDGRWTVTHVHPCPNSHDDQAHTLRKTLTVLDDLDSDARQLMLAVHNLSRLAATGWLDAQVWRTRVMTSYAARAMDRLELEELLDAHLPALSPTA